MRIKSNRYLVGMGMMLALAAAYAPPAAAVTFTFEQIGGFTHGTETPFVSGESSTADGIQFFHLVGTPASTYSIIGWGDSSNHNPVPTGVNPYTNSDRSSLALETNGTPTVLPSPFTGGMVTTVDSNGVPVVISRLYHQNRAITAPFLTGITIDTRLTIFDGGPVLVDFGSVPITFVETLNSSPCPSAVNPLGSVCDDRFTFSVADFDPVPFSSNGVDYLAFFGLVVPSGNTDCSLASGQGSCVDMDPNTGIGTAYTREGSDNRLDVTMWIEEVPPQVPAPSALVLLGIGLLGTAAAHAWRKRSGQSG